MIASQSQRLHCMTRDAAATVTFYPDTQTVRICAEGGQCCEKMRWHFGRDALLDVIGARPSGHASEQSSLAAA